MNNAQIGVGMSMPINRHASSTPAALTKAIDYALSFVRESP